MEEIYLSPDGLYEYSLVELEQAAKENNITVQEFISSRGFKLKGDEVEETIEIEDKKPLTPTDLQLSNVDVNEKLDLGIVQTEAPATTTFADRNKVEIDKLDPNSNLVQAPMTSTVMQNEIGFKAWVDNNKEEDLANIENSISLDPTNNYSIEQIQILNSLGVEGAKAIEGIDDVPDNQKSWVVGQINERINKSFANEDGSTPRAAEVFNVLEYKEIGDINKKRDQYVQDQIVLGPDGKGAGLSNEQIKEDIVKYFNNHRSEGIENRIKKYAGESLYNKLKKCSISRG